SIEIADRVRNGTCPPQRTCDRTRPVHSAFRTPHSALDYPPAIGGNSATSSPSCTRASSLTCFRFTAARGRSGSALAPGKSSRTRRTTSPTAAGSGLDTAAPARPRRPAHGRRSCLAPVTVPELHTPVFVRPGLDLANLEQHIAGLEPGGLGGAPGHHALHHELAGVAGLGIQPEEGTGLGLPSDRDPGLRKHALVRQRLPPVDVALVDAGHVGHAGLPEH